MNDRPPAGAAVESSLSDIDAAEQRFRATVAGFGDEDLRAPSLCPGWSRGHVVAHVALNAGSLVNLIEWARTGAEIPQYPSPEARDADIERHSGRSPDEHLAALDGAARRFAGAARALPSDRWSFEVRGIGGTSVPVERYLLGRLSEVEIHHVDLDAGYGPGDWPRSFVEAALGLAGERLGPRVAYPFVIDATDLGARAGLGAGEPRTVVSGAGSSLLSWLLGRGDGRDLDGDGGELPPVPSWG